MPQSPEARHQGAWVDPQPPLRFDELGLRPILREAAAVDNPSNRPKKRRIPRWIKAEDETPQGRGRADTDQAERHTAQAQNQPKFANQPKASGPDHRNRQAAESRAERSLQ